MIPKDFTQDEIDYLLERCNFVNKELAMFKMRAGGMTLEEIAFKLDIPISSVKYISQKVNKKIIKVL